MNIEPFVTSTGSSVAPSILKRVIRRIEQDKEHHDYMEIIDDELRGIVDDLHEAEEVYDHCLELFNKNKQNESTNN